MAKASGGNGNLIKYVIGAVVVGGIAYVATGSDDSSKSSKQAVLPPTSKTSSDPNSPFIPADYKASFDKVTALPKDAFNPLVSKLTTGAGGDGNGIPGSITGGESDWSYTGMVKIDGKPEALLENSKTNLSVFLGIGQHWKRAKVQRISDSDVEFVVDDGDVARVKMGELASNAKSEVASATAPAAVQPPALTGSINGGLDVTPLPAVDPSGGNGGGGRRGGRRRGGWNGGGGGGAFGNGGPGAGTTGSAGTAGGGQ